MKVETSGTYHGVIENMQLVRLADGKSAFKVYFVSIEGRPEPTRFEWSKTAMDKAAFLKAFETRGVEGVGFVTAFPHITKIFRYNPKSEVILTVKAYNTVTGAEINLDRGEGYMEFACLAEAMIADGEYRLWGKAASVEEYLAASCPMERADIVREGKLKAYWEGN